MARFNMFLVASVLNKNGASWEIFHFMVVMHSRLIRCFFFMDVYGSSELTLLSTCCDKFVVCLRQAWAVGCHAV